MDESISAKKLRNEMISTMVGHKAHGEKKAVSCCDRIMKMIMKSAKRGNNSVNICFCDRHIKDSSRPPVLPRPRISMSDEYIYVTWFKRLGKCALDAMYSTATRLAQSCEDAGCDVKAEEWKDRSGDYRINIDVSWATSNFVEAAKLADEGDVESYVSQECAELEKIVEGKVDPYKVIRSAK